jgi:hypothetical protein
MVPMHMTIAIPSHLSDGALIAEVMRCARDERHATTQLVDGSLTVTSVRLLARHLNAENHRELLAAASRRSKREVEELIARCFPKPDTPSSVRKVPERTQSPLPVEPTRPATEPAQAVSAPASLMVAPRACTDGA